MKPVIRKLIESVRDEMIWKTYSASLPLTESSHRNLWTAMLPSMLKLVARDVLTMVSPRLQSGGIRDQRISIQIEKHKAQSI